MKFGHAQCEICLQSFFKPTDVSAYQLRGREPKALDLGDRQPWVGVRCICKGCIEFVSGLSDSEGIVFNK